MKKKQEEAKLTKFAGHKFKIRSGTVGAGTRILMDGKPLMGTTLLNVNINVDSINTILLEFIPQELDVQIDAVAKAIQKENPGTKLVDVTAMNGDGTRKYVKNPKPE